MTGIRITVEPDDSHHGHHHGHDHDHCCDHDPHEVVPFEKEEDDLPPKEAGDDERTRELIAQEERASNDYEQLADEADDEDTKEVYRDISNEEKVHAGELLILLLKQDPKQKEALEQGSEEVAELVGGESFRDLFDKGRKKVIDKANGESFEKAEKKVIDKAKPKPTKVDTSDWLGRKEGSDKAKQEKAKAQKKITQGSPSSMTAKEPKPNVHVNLNNAHVTGNPKLLTPDKFGKPDTHNSSDTAENHMAEMERSSLGVNKKVYSDPIERHGEKGEHILETINKYPDSAVKQYVPKPVFEVHGTTKGFMYPMTVKNPYVPPKSRKLKEDGEDISTDEFMSWFS